MTRRFILGLVVALASCAIWIGAPIAAQQARDTSKPVPGPVGNGALGGTVTNDDGSRPVRFAYVVLLGTGKGTINVTSSDSDGKFMFTGLAADRYTVGASKPPYLGTIAGARRAARPGTPVVLADGQKIANVAIRMPLGAAITGVITDEKGQPGSNVSITLQQWRMQNGERALVSAGFAATDDRGRYRFHGLVPGEYVVAGSKSNPVAARTLTTAEVDAAMRGGAVAPAAPLAQSTLRFAEVFYPGTTRMTEAVSIALAAGEERPNIDFKLEMVQTAKVEGVVAGGDGQPVMTGALALRTAGPSPMRQSFSVRSMPDGRFTFSGIPPGTYTLTAVGIPPAYQFASTIVDVAGVDVFGVQLTMQPAPSFSAQLVFKGAAALPTLAGRRIAFRNVTPALAGPQLPNVTATNQTGGFTVSNVFPGRYVIGGPLGFGPNTDSMTWALESVIVDGKDVTDLPIEINGDSIPKDVVVTYSDRFQELSGRLARSTGAPVSEHTIIVFPEDKAYWVSGSRRILVTRPGTDGRFTLSGAGPTTLPPGKYLLATVTDIDRDEQFDPAFLAAIVPAAVPITLLPGDKKVQDLVVK